LSAGLLEATRVSAGPSALLPPGHTLFCGAIRSFGCLHSWSSATSLLRRICRSPSSPTIPRALALQRNSSGSTPRAGKKRMELAKVPPDSGFGRQLRAAAIRLVVRSSLRPACCSSIRSTVWAGWCCSRSPVRSTVGYLSAAGLLPILLSRWPSATVYSTTPADLLAAKAHTSEQLIPSRCAATVLPDGSEQSACVACSNLHRHSMPKRMYWAQHWLNPQPAL